MGKPPLNVWGTDTGKRRDIGLGSAKLVTLAAVRAKAAEALRATREDGRDLVAEMRKAKAESVTFREAADAYLEAYTAPLDRFLRRAGAIRWLDRITGAVFLAFAAKLATAPVR